MIPAQAHCDPDVGVLQPGHVRDRVVGDDELPGVHGLRVDRLDLRQARRRWHGLDRLVFSRGAKAFKARWTDVMNLRYFVTANFPKINDKLPGDVVKSVLKKVPVSKFKTPGTGAVAFLYSLLKLNWFEAGELLLEPAAMLDIVNVDAFDHLGAANKPKNAEGVAELNVWQLKKSMHTCIVDVAAMVDVLVITITASFLKVRNLADA